MKDKYSKDIDNMFSKLDHIRGVSKIRAQYMKELVKLRKKYYTKLMKEVAKSLKNS